MVSGSMSKLSNSTTISDILGAKIMKVQSRLLGYLSGKPGVLMTPLGAVKFLEHSGPARRETARDADEFLKCRDVFGQSDGFSLGPRCELSGVTDRTSGSLMSCLWEFKTETKGFFQSNISKIENRS